MVAGAASGASHVAALSSDGTLRVWDHSSAATATAPIAVFERIGRGLGATAWSPDGALLAAATWTVEAGRGVQGWVHLWRFDDRQLLWKVPYGVKPIAALAFSPDGRQLVVGTWDGRIGMFAAPGPAPSPTTSRSRPSTEATPPCRASASRRMAAS